MKHFWKCLQDVNTIKTGFEAVRVDRPVGIPMKHVELCYPEFSHFLSFSFRCDFDTREVWPIKKFWPCCWPKKFKLLDPVADAASLWLRIWSIRLSCFYHLLRVICWSTGLIRSAIKMSYFGVVLTPGIPVATEHRLPPPHTHTHTHTFVTAPYRIFLAPTGLTGTGV